MTRLTVQQQRAMAAAIKNARETALLPYATTVRQEPMMAVPKRKTSRSNTRHRRAHWKATAPHLVPVTVDGREHLVPRRLAKAYERGLLTP